MPFRPITLDVQADPILMSAHLDRGTPSHETSKHKFEDYGDPGLGVSIQSHWIDSVHEPVEQQAFPAGKAALGGPHSLRVLSSEAVSNSFLSDPELLPHQIGYAAHKGTL